MQTLSGSVQLRFKMFLHARFQNVCRRCVLIQVSSTCSSTTIPRSLAAQLSSIPDRSVHFPPGFKLNMPVTMQLKLLVNFRRWHCWLGVRKSVWPVKILSDEVLVWLSVWSEVQIVCVWSSWCHCHPKTPSSFALFKSRLVLPFWHRLIQVVLEKRPLNGCGCCLTAYDICFFYL